LISQAIDGQLLSTSTENKIDVSALSKGSYVVQLTSANETTAQSFIIK
jgi:hypothetical protein